MRYPILAAAAITALAGHAAASVTIYTSRAAWQAAVSGSIQTEDFTSSSVQTFTNLTTQAGLVQVAVDRLSSTAGNNPGILNFGGANGHVLGLNHQDPTAGFDTGAPHTTTLSFGGPISAFGSDFFQVGVTPGPSPVGTVTVTVGADAINLNASLDANGNGFFGVISTTPITGLSFTFLRSGSIVNDVFQMDNVAFAAAPPSCYPNCDNSTSAPVLNVLDFACFLNRYASGDTYANCDSSTTPPVLNVLDFACFLNSFASGCP